jgi:hypothetical protein
MGLVLKWKVTRNEPFGHRLRKSTCCRYRRYDPQPEIHVQRCLLAATPLRDLADRQRLFVLAQGFDVMGFGH